MIILGLNAYHADAAACLLRDGQIVAAAEEERFRRIKHWAGFPSQAIAYCLQEAGVGLGVVDHVAVNSDPKVHRLERLAHLARHRPDLALVLDRFRNRRKRLSVADELAVAFPGQRFKGSVHRVEHHLAHLASAFFASPFEEAAVLSLDGFGDFSSTAWGSGHGNAIAIEKRVLFPHSIGLFYQALTQYLGFPHYGDEYKVMGLAPYGRPTFLDRLRRVVRLEAAGTFALDLRYFRHHREKIAFDWQGGAPVFAPLYSDALEGLLGPARAPNEALTERHHDIASSVQALYEEVLDHILQAVWDKYRLPNLALAGGCALNSVANGKIRQTTAFRHLYVQPAAGDAGGALGAALALWHQTGGRRTAAMDHAYWGPAYAPDDIDQLLAAETANLAAMGCDIRHFGDDGELCRETASAIAAGHVVGWFDGRMEWGPRALGSRSILCDPRRADIKQLLNHKIKRRESFRPFAPSILTEHAADWFEGIDEVPFMTEVLPVRRDKRALVPAITHVDGTGRPQTVQHHANPAYHTLISAFFAQTGVPMVLNTSFNENEPIVCTPREALDCFLRTRMDILVLGHVIIRRRQDVAPAAMPDSRHAADKHVAGS
ncbi:carbamoyltransferase [Labrys sp. WJW]|uniref:carbamoyltransferase family protein n=1 Tax=Labrys sp. WJW TaxID=1737983 RepID=UPI00082F50BF|nr:carbamoyltransferase C-terminal domain-containing protein [Labrys sp. WJW]OCC06838.1 carbamoyltransferase [Labrys sp. WJW]